MNNSACNVPSCLSCPARNGSHVIALRRCLVLTGCAIRPAPCSVFPVEWRDKFLCLGSVFWTRFVLIFRTQAPLHWSSCSPPPFLTILVTTNNPWLNHFFHLQLPVTRLSPSPAVSSPTPPHPHKVLVETSHRSRKKAYLKNWDIFSSIQ